VELIRREDISWIKPDEPVAGCLWAPSVLHKDGTYFLYFSVGPQEPARKSRIGVATAPRPWGPFKDSGKMLPVLRDKFEAIDPMVFLDPRSGAAYLYAGGSDGSTLKVFRLKPDMVTIDEEVKDVPQPVAFTEAPFMHARRGVYYLSYSHGRWNQPEYSVHYSTSSFPTGPWTYQGPILSEDGKRRGPGHHAFVTDPATGTDLILYHRWDRPGDLPFNGSRSVALDRVHYCSDGRILPVVMTDNGSRAALPSQREPEERAAGAAATAREAGGD
jgi:beta-xylosidase